MAFIGEAETREKGIPCGTTSYMRRNGRHCYTCSEKEERERTLTLG